MKASNDIKQKSQFRRRANSIDNLISAWTLSDLEKAPSYYQLQEIYEMVMLDLPLLSAWGRRKHKVLGEGVGIYSDTGRMRLQSTQLEKIPFLSDLIGLIMDAKLYGYSYIQIIENKLSLIDRRYCVPQRNAFTTTQGGTSYKYEQDYEDLFFSIANPEKGLLLPISFAVLMRRPNLQAWAEYNDDFAVPIPVIKTPLTIEPTERARLEQNVSEIRTKRMLLLENGNEYSVVEQAKTDSKIFSELDRVLKEEILEYVEGSSKSIETDNKTYINKTVAELTPQQEMQEADMQWVEKEMNTKVMPILRKLGFITGAVGSFSFTLTQEKKKQTESKIKVATNEGIALYSFLQSAGKIIPDSYFTETYGIPFVEMKEQIENETELQENKTEQLQNENKQSDEIEEEIEEPENENQVPESDKKQDTKITNLFSGDLVLFSVLNKVYNVDEDLQAYESEDFKELYSDINTQILNYSVLTDIVKKEAVIKKMQGIYLENFLKVTNDSFKDISAEKRSSFKKNIESYMDAKVLKQTSEIDNFKGLFQEQKDFEDFLRERNKVYSGTWQKIETQQAKAVFAETRKYEYEGGKGLRQYVATLDARVRPEHKKFNGIIFDSDDPILKVLNAPNGFNCRCTTIKANRRKVTNLTDAQKQELVNGIDEGFAFDFVGGGIVFGKDTGYFKYKKNEAV